MNKLRSAPAKWEEITLATIQIGDTLIEYLAATNGDEFADFLFQTRLKNNMFPEFSRREWIDASFHATALDAIMDADNYMQSTMQEPYSELLSIAANLYATASATMARREAQA